MRSLAAAIAAGLVGAAMLHIVIILAIPHFSGGQAFARVEALGPAGRFHVLERGKPELALTEANPYLRSAICAFDASAAPVHVFDGETPPFWSVAVFDTASNEVYSMNDRTAVERRMDMTLATPLQLIALRRSKPDALAKSILVELDDPKGYVVIRTIAEDETWERIAGRFLSAAKCAPLAAG